MDPFQIRMEFLALLKRLNASEDSIRKIVAFALRYATRCADDLWDCVMTECAKAPSNTRINVLFMLDAFLSDDFQTNPAEVAVYRTLAQRDLPLIIDLVVPSGRWDAVLNSASTRQILLSWESKRLFDAQLLLPLVAMVDERVARYAAFLTQCARQSTARRHGGPCACVTFRCATAYRRGPRTCTSPHSPSTSAYVRTAGNCRRCRIYMRFSRHHHSRRPLPTPTRSSSTSFGKRPAT